VTAAAPDGAPGPERRQPLAAPPEVAAAIAAAVEAVWPRPVVVVADEAGSAADHWRLSGRWWAKPLVARRDRPWRW